jgi:hypothetical protein
MAARRRDGEQEPCAPTPRIGAAACAAVVRIRAAAAPLQRFVGFQLGDAHGAAFADGPLLVIMLAVAAPLVVRLLLAVLWRRRSGRG